MCVCRSLSLSLSLSLTHTHTHTPIYIYIYIYNWGDKIPTVREKPVKSLGRLYSIPLTDRHRGTEVQKVAVKGLKSIDKTCLPGRMKAWCYQHGLLPRLLCPLQMFEIAISRVEWIQQYCNKYLRKWLGVPPCFSKVGLYTNSGNIQLPISSLVEEFKIGKVRLHMMMKDSADEIIRKAYPEIKSGTKWSAVKTAQEAKCSLRIKDIIGITQTNRAGLGNTSKKIFFKMDPKGKRDMVSKEVRMFEEEQRKARLNNVLGQNEMISNQLNYRGNP